MVGKGAGGKPVPPVRDRVRQLRLGLGDGFRDGFAPRHGHERGLAGIEGGAPIAPSPCHSETEAGGHREGGVTHWWVHGHGPVAVAVIVPLPRHRAVLEQRDRVNHDLDPTLDAGGQAEERAGGGVVTWGAAVVGAPVTILHRPDDEQVLDEQPAGRRVPGRLQHHRPGQVAALVGYVRIAGTEAKEPGGAVEDGSEHAGRVGPGQAQPFHRAVRCHQAVGLAIRQEAVVGDRREVGGAGVGAGVTFRHVVFLSRSLSHGWATAIGRRRQHDVRTTTGVPTPGCAAITRNGRFGPGQVSGPPRQAPHRTFAGPLPGIRTAGHHQLLVGATLDHPAAVEHHDLVHGGQAGQPVSDDHGGPAAGHGDQIGGQGVGCRGIEVLPGSSTMRIGKSPSRPRAMPNRWR